MSGLTATFPVTDPSTGLSYVNATTAACNGANLTQVKYWTKHVASDKTTSPEQLINTLDTSTVLHLPPDIPGIPARACVLIPLYIRCDLALTDCRYQLRIDDVNSRDFLFSKCAALNGSETTESSSVDKCHIFFNKPKTQPKYTFQITMSLFEGQGGVEILNTETVDAPWKSAVCSAVKSGGISCPIKCSPGTTLIDEVCEAPNTITVTFPLNKGFSAEISVQTEKIVKNTFSSVLAATEGLNYVKGQVANDRWVTPLGIKMHSFVFEVIKSSNDVQEEINKVAACAKVKMSSVYKMSLVPEWVNFCFEHWGYLDEEWGGETTTSLEYGSKWQKCVNLTTVNPSDCCVNQAVSQGNCQQNLHDSCVCCTPYGCLFILVVLIGYICNV